jgi:hypothetical protein
LIAAIGPELGIRGTQTRGVWSYISGLSHPSLTRSISASDIEMLSDAPTSGALFTANWTVVAMALDAAMLARIAALRLAARRGQNPRIEWDVTQMSEG